MRRGGGRGEMGGRVGKDKLESELPVCRRQENSHCKLIYRVLIFCLRQSRLLYSGLLQSKWRVEDVITMFKAVSDARVRVGETFVMGCNYKNVSGSEIFPGIVLKTWVRF